MSVPPFVPRLATGALLALAPLAAVTGAVQLLRPFAPVLSLGALYVLAVLPVAVVLGRSCAVAVSLASVLVFNFLFLPPRLKLTLAGEENWLILVVYLVTGLLVSDLASRVRRRTHEAEQREREASLLAEISTALLSGAEVASELPRIAAATARILGLPNARIEPGPPRQPRTGEAVVELRVGDRQVGTLYSGGGVEPAPSARRRFLPALASLLAIAIDRERLAREALEAEALRRSDSLKTALLRTVSHDLRSPLTTIRASLEALESAELELATADRENLVRSALAEAQRLDRVVRNLLDLSRLQAGTAEPDPRLRTIEGLVHQALAHVASSEGRVDVAIAPELPLVHVDPLQLEHALANLLENALKFSPPDSRVRIDVARHSDEIVVRVVDRGPGLHAVELDRVFEPFRRASTTSGRQGTGLGLAIAKGFVEANGGRIWAESQFGEGASFVLALPAALELAHAPS